MSNIRDHHAIAPRVGHESASSARGCHSRIANTSEECRHCRGTKVVSARFLAHTSPTLASPSKTRKSEMASGPKGETSSLLRLTFVHLINRKGSRHGETRRTSLDQAYSIFAVGPSMILHTPVLALQNQRHYISPTLIRLCRASCGYQ